MIIVCGQSTLIFQLLQFDVDGRYGASECSRILGRSQRAVFDKVGGLIRN